MAKRPIIWLTRPREDSTAFAIELTAHGIDSIIAPVLHIVRQPMPSLAIHNPAALLITSRHAAHALAELPASWRALPAYCVGSATARAASEHGLTHIIPGARDVLALLPTMTSDLAPDSHVLYLAGDETRTDVLGLLAAHHIHVSTAIVYHAIAERALNDEIRAALIDNRITAAAFFSPRSAEITCALITSLVLFA
jgi:uroporphyrinogen-III synthase